MTRTYRIGLAGMALGMLTGCSYEAFTYTNDRYALLAGMQTVTLSCRDSYEIYDRPDAGAVLVITNALNEALVGCLDGGRPSMTERQQQAAQLYIEEKSNRPQCRITGNLELSVFHREFTYTCAAPPPQFAPRPRRS